MLANLLQEFASPLSRDQVNKIRDALSDLSLEQVNWLSGYLAGLSATASATGLKDISSILASSAGANSLEQTSDSDALLNASTNIATKVDLGEQRKTTILYGSQTGNARGVAELLKSQLAGVKENVQLIDMSEYNPKQLKKEQQVWLIVSTHGEGEPPDDALDLYEFIHSKKAPNLSDVEFSVLALGDSSYEFYCQTGKDFDLTFEKLGATRVIERVDCDVDYFTDSDTWAKQVYSFIEKSLPEVNVQEESLDSDVHSDNHRPHLSVVDAGQTLDKASYSKFKPFTAEVVDVFPITSDDSPKPTYHVELSLENSGLSYQPGDALGVWPVNTIDLVDETLMTLGLSAEHEVKLAERTTSLSDALQFDFELTQVTPALVKAINQQVNNPTLANIISDRTQLNQLLTNYQVPELLKEYSASFTADELLSHMRRMTPRLYSIASSQDETDDEVHLTVALVNDERDGINRQGAASRLLSNLESGDTVKVFVEANKNFKLPADSNINIIMVGAGTGVAPYRGFIQQRAANHASGENWMVFGNPHFASDFLYQTEWQQWIKKGVLNRFDLAFSRDQAEKIYVQDRLLTQAADIYFWLEQGAHIYVCGDKDRLGHSVENALLKIFKEQGKLTDEQADHKLSELRKAGRYQKDVY